MDKFKEIVVDVISGVAAIAFILLIYAVYNRLMMGSWGI